VLGRDAEAQEADLPAMIGLGREEEFAFRGEVIPIRELQRRCAAWAHDRLGGNSTSHLPGVGGACGA
jgi:hypothetical protein